MVENACFGMPLMEPTIKAISCSSELEVTLQIVKEAVRSGHRVQFADMQRIESDVAMLRSENAELRRRVDLVAPAEPEPANFIAMMPKRCSPLRDR